MDDRHFTLAMFMWEDCQKVIAASKVQRWNTLQWAATTNIVIAGVAVALKRAAIDDWTWIFLVAAVVVVALSVWVINFYDRRITQMRLRTNRILGNLTKAGIDIWEVYGPDRTPDGKTIITNEREASYGVGPSPIEGQLYEDTKEVRVEDYDRRELRSFYGSLCLSLLPIIVIVVVENNRFLPG